MDDLSVLKRRVGSLEFMNPLVFGGGTCKTLEEVKRACRRRGLRSLVVEVPPGNTAALSAYRSVGFDDSGRSLLTLSLADKK